LALAQPLQSTYDFIRQPSVAAGGSCLEARNRARQVLNLANVQADPTRAAELKKTIEIKLLYVVGKDAAHASIHDWYIATALSIRGRIVDRWIESTRRTYSRAEKRVYYLSLEFLIGRLLTDSISNLELMADCRTALTELGVDFEAVRAVEPDAALGNGG